MRIISQFILHSVENSPLPDHIFKSSQGWDSRGMGRWVGILGMMKSSLSSLWPDSAGCRPGLPSPLNLPTPAPILPSPSSILLGAAGFPLAPAGLAMCLPFLFTSSSYSPLACLHFPFLLNLQHSPSSKFCTCSLLYCRQHLLQRFLGWGGKGSGESLEICACWYLKDGVLCFKKCGFFPIKRWYPTFKAK